MRRRVDVAVRLLGVLAVVVVVGWVGCSGDDTGVEFDCEVHDECLDDEACLDQTCVDAPVEDESCPDEHEGEEYDNLRCEDGEWIDFEIPEAPTVEAVEADPPTADAQEVLELNVEVSSEVEDELTYQWSAPEDWNLQDQDQPTVELLATEEWGETATIEVEVIDPYDQSDSGEVTVSTHEVDGPQIEDIEADPQTVVPDTTQVVTADVDHPQELEVDYDWTVPDEWAEETDDGDEFEIRAPDEHDVSDSVEVTVTDTEGLEATASTSVSTHDNPGPTIEELEADEYFVEPESTIEVAVEADHELGHDLVDYDWSMEGEDWTVEADEEDQTIATITTPDEFETKTDVTVEVIDEYGALSEADREVGTIAEDNEPPVIEEFAAEDNPVETGGTTEVHVEATDPMDYDLSYEWTIEGDDWELEVDDDDETVAQLDAPDEYDSTVEVTIEVVDEFGESADEMIEVMTKTEQNEPPIVDELAVEETPLLPGESTQVVVEATDPFDLDLSYSWEVDDGDWTVESDDNDQTAATVTAPDETGASTDVTVTVEDDAGEETEATESVETITNQGPTLDWVEPDGDGIVDPGETIDVAAGVDHPHGFEVDYDWTVEADASQEGWEIVDGADGEIATLEAPDEAGTEAMLEVEVTDDYGGDDTETSTVETTTNEGPEIVAVEPDEDGVVDPGESTEVTVDANHDQGFELHYSWDVVADDSEEGWQVTAGGESDEVTVEAPNETSTTASLEVEVTDDYGGEETGSASVDTVVSDGPEIVSIDVTGDEVVEPGDETTVSVAATHPQDFELDYSWDVTADDSDEGWQVTAGGESDEVTVEAPNETSTTASLEVVVTDEYGDEETDSATVETVVSDGPEIVSIGVTGDEVVEPGDETTVEVDANHPQDFELHYSWDVTSDDSEDGWQIVEGGDQLEVTLEAPDEPDTTVDVEVTVSDDYDDQVTAEETVQTMTNDGPELDSLEVQGDTELSPGETVDVEAQTSHPQGLELSYNWAFTQDDSDEGWEIIDGADDGVATVEAADEPGTFAVLEVTVSDEYGESESDDAILTTESSDGPQIDTELWADDNPMAPDETTDVHIEASHPQDYSLSYQWDIDDEGAGWDIDGDESTATVTPPHEPDVGTVVDVTVSDPYGDSESDTLVVDTRENQDPNIQGTDPAEDDLMPADSTTVTVDVDHPFGFAMDYDWDIAGSGWEITGGQGTATLEVSAPDETGSSAELTVTVTDDYDGEAVGTTTVDTVDNPGPVVEDLDGAPEDDIDPGDSRTVTAETSHELGFDLDYNWELDTSDWTVVDEDEEMLQIESPEEPNSELTVTYTVTDDYGGEDQQSGTLATIDNDPPQITSSAATPSPPYELGEDFNLDGDGYDPDGGPVYYEWNTDGDWDIDSPDSSFTAAWAPEQTELEDIDLVITDQWGYTDTETVEVRTYDYVPSPFGFTDKDEVAPNTWVESEQMEMEDFEEPVDAECFGCEVRKDDGNYQGTVEDVEPGDDIQIRVESATYDESVSAHVEVGETESDEWTVESRSWEGMREFTTCGLDVSPTGPSQSDCDSIYNGALDGEVDVDDGIQQWTVPADGTYEIEVWGAGDDDSAAGARVEGEVELNAGTELDILVGQQGEGGLSGGGHGGTFVAKGSGSEPVMVAGGAASSGGLTSESGGDGEVIEGGGDAGDGGTGGDGGEDGVGTNGQGGGGGGFDSGGTGNSEFSGEGFTEGGEGGTGSDQSSGYGGFGGGGGSGYTTDTRFSRRSMGGGGGYSGGGGAWGTSSDTNPEIHAGAGGSYVTDDAEDTLKIEGFNDDVGQVTIDLVELD